MYAHGQEPLIQTETAASPTYIWLIDIEQKSLGWSKQADSYRVGNRRADFI